jgi:hypothetical protein
MQPKELVEKILKIKSYAIQNAHIHKNGVSFTFHRNLVDRPSAGFDRFEISVGQQDPKQAEYLLNTTASIAKHFGVGKIASQLSSLSSSEPQDWLAASHGALQQMQETALAMSADLVKSRKDLEELFNEKQLKTDNYLSAKQADLETEHQKKLEKLSEERAELDTLRQQLDDRNNTHVRREIRQKLKEQVKERYANASVTKKTLALRTPIHIACVAGLAATGFGAYYFGIQMVDSMTKTGPASDIGLLFIIARQIGLTFGFLALLAYYLRWMNRWFDKSSQSDFDLRQFDLDIDRASWVVETGLEWRQSEGDAMPSVILENITRNLFSSQTGDRKEELHPADYLSRAILGNAKGLKVSLPGAEVELDARSVRKDAARHRG